MARGREAGTREVGTTVACRDCGVSFGARYVAFVDRGENAALVRRLLEEGFAATGSVVCPQCGTTYIIEEGVTILDAAADVLCVFAPPHRRHRALSLQAEALEHLATRALEVVTTSLSTPALHFDVTALRRTLGTQTESVGAATRATPTDDLPFDADSHPPQAAPADREVTSRVDLAKQPELPTPRRSNFSAVTMPDIPRAVAPSEARAPRETEPEESSAARGGDSTQVKARAAVNPSSGASSADAWNRALDAAWGAAPEPEAPANADPTHVVSIDMATTARPAVTQRHRIGPAFDSARADASGAYLQVEDGRVQAVAQLELTRANGFAQGQVSLAFQWHATSAGPALDLLLTRREAGETVDHLVWWITPTTETGRSALATLSADFVVDVVLHLDGGAFHARRTVREPLEHNVSTASEYLRDLPSLPDAEAVKRAVEAVDFDLFGRLQHNFHAESFAELRSAAEARLAVGIVSYWSAPERRDYLTRVKSFPEVWWSALVERVVRGAVDFGIALDAPLRRRAVELGVVSDAERCVETTLANFAEVCLSLKANELDALDVWENWASLLAHADELDVRVAEDIEALAALSMERARDAAQAGDPGDGDVADESVEMEVGEDLAEMSTSELAGLLYDPAQRFDAAIAILHRGEAGQASSVFEVMRRMSRDQLQRAVPLALAQGPAFESAFLGALRSQRVSLRLAASLFLAEIRSERAIPRVVECVARAGIEEWQFIARAAARLGRKIIPAVMARAGTDGDPGERLAFTLALLGAEARGALAAAVDRESSDGARVCAQKAIERAGEVSFGDPADFSERLADAFQACGPDAVGPDFEEELASVEIGPAASARDLEADVDLDDYDDPRGR